MDWKHYANYLPIPWGAPETCVPLNTTVTAAFREQFPVVRLEVRLLF